MQEERRIATEAYENVPDIKEVPGVSLGIGRGNAESHPLGSLSGNADRRKSMDGVCGRGLKFANPARMISTRWR